MPPGDRSPGLCVVIPHRSRVDLLQKALAAVEGWPVLVADDSEAGLELDVESVRVGQGEGFARAANAGLEEAERRGHTRVLLLNDDAAPEPGCIEALDAAMTPGFDLVGPLLTGVDGVESAGLRFSERTGRLRQLTDPPPGPNEVDALSGACLLMRSHLRFDEAFPHAMEDVALARQVRGDGGRVLIVPAARCAHQGGATIDRNTREAQRDALRGHLRLVDGSPLRKLFVVGFAVGQVLREGRSPERLLGIVDGVGGAWRA